MDILKYAMQMEKDGEVYYRQLIDQVTNKETTLAELEAATADYEYFREELYKTQTQIEYFPKLLPPESAIQGTYRYLDKLSTRRASFNYDFRDF